MGEPKNRISNYASLLESLKLLEHTQSTVPMISRARYRRGEMICAHALPSAVCLIVGTQKRSQTKFPI